MLAKKFEQARGAEAGALHDGARIAEGCGPGANLGDELLDAFEDRVGAAGEVVGVAFFAGTQSGGAGGFGGREEAGVFALRFAG
jgi:hypothetical protein